MKWTYARNTLHAWCFGSDYDICTKFFDCLMLIVDRRYLASFKFFHIHIVLFHDCRGKARCTRDPLVQIPVSLIDMLSCFMTVTWKHNRKWRVQISISFIYQLWCCITVISKHTRLTCVQTSICSIYMLSSCMTLISNHARVLRVQTSVAWTVDIVDNGACSTARKASTSHCIHKCTGKIVTSWADRCMCRAAVFNVGRDDWKKSFDTGRWHQSDRTAPVKWHLERSPAPTSWYCDWEGSDRITCCGQQELCKKAHAAGAVLSPLPE